MLIIKKILKYKSDVYDSFCIFTKILFEPC